jgi:hypothetical protein
MSDTDKKIAIKVYMETKSLIHLKKPNPQKNTDLRKQVAHALYNSLMAGSLPDLRRIDTLELYSKNEKDAYASCINAVEVVKAEREKKIDPTNGATNFNIKFDERGDYQIHFYR